MSSLFKPQLQPTNQIVKMGIDAKDIGDIPVVLKHAQYTSNGKAQVKNNSSIEKGN